MKKRNQLILLSSAIIIALGSLIVLKTQPKTNETTEVSDTVTEPLINLTKDDLKKVTIGEGDMILSFKPTDDAWQIISENAFVWDNSQIDSALNGILSLTPERTILEGDLEGFGLLEPQKTITYLQQDDQAIKLSIGLTTPDGNSVYAMLENDPNVYLLPTYSFDAISGDQNHYREQKLAEYDRNSVISLKASGRELPLFQIESHPHPSVDTSTHILTTPTSKAINIDTTYFLELTNHLPSLDVDQFIADDVTDLSIYGLDQPYLHLQWEVHGTDEEGNPITETFDYQWGDLTEDKQNIYFKETNSNSVYLMNSDIILSLTELFDVYSLSAKTPLITHIDSVKSVDIVLDKQSYHFTIERTTVPVTNEEKSTETDAEIATETQEEVVSTYYLDSKEISETTFKDLYGLIISLRTDTNLTEQIASNDKKPMPVASITFTLNDDSVKTHTFYPYDNQFYSYELDESLIVGLDRKQFDYLKENLETAKKAIQ